MQSERKEHQSWRVHVTAKANNFNLRLKLRLVFAAATNKYKPTFNFSILLKLPKFALTINSQQTHGPRFFTNKFMKIVHKIRPPWPKKKESNVPCLKGPIRVGFWVIGFLAFLAQSISKHGQRGIATFASVRSLFFLYRKLKIAKLRNLVTFFSVVVGVIFYHLFFNFDYNYNYWDYMGWTWNKMVSL